MENEVHEIAEDLVALNVAEEAPNQSKEHVNVVFIGHVGRLYRIEKARASYLGLV